MRRTHLLVVCLALLTALPFAARLSAAEPAEAILGLWQTQPTENGFAKVRIERADDRYRGVVVELSEPLFPASEGPEWVGKPKVDRNNPDASEQSRPIIGLAIVWDFEYKGENRWEGGRIYDPENGKTYKAKLHLAEDGSLDLRGFIGFSLLGRTTRWQRVEDGG